MHGPRPSSWILPFLISSAVVSGGNQTPAGPTPTGLITGRVVAAGSSSPIEGAVVRLSNLEPAPITSFTAESNARGEFRFSDLPPGRYDLTATRNRYLPVTYGQKRLGSGGPGISIRLTNGQHVDDLSVSMPLPAVIAGVVTDVRGEPAQGSRVRLLRYEWVVGQRTLREAGQGVADDRGQYRIAELRPGEYLVVAALRTNTNPGDPPPPAQMFYPGTPLVEAAQSIVVEAGDERDGINLQLRPVRLASVSGVVVSRPGQRFEGARLTAVNTAAPWLPTPGITQFTTYGIDSAGKFTLINLAPGRYQLTAIAQENTAAPEAEFWAMTDIDVGADDLTDVRLMLQRAGTMSGRIVADPAKPGATTAGTVTLDPLDPGRLAFVAFGRLDAEHRFTIGGLVPGRYALRFTFLPRGVFIRSIRVAGRDATDLAIEVGPSDDVRDVEVRMTDAGTAIAGTLLDASGQPTPDYLVVVFPADEKYWIPGTSRIRTTRPASDGRYAFANLPPGAYRLAALTDAEPNEWTAASFLRKIAPASVAVTIAEGETRTLDVRVR